MIGLAALYGCGTGARSDVSVLHTPPGQDVALETVLLEDVRRA